MTEPKSKAARNPLKVAGGILLLGGSLWLFFHRLPHREYVAVHADKPRPKAAAAVPAPPAAAVQPVSQAAALAKPSSAAAARSEVKVSSAPVVDSIYTVARLRDPFARLGASRGAARAFSLEDFSIHKLSLRGVMRDSGTDYALFVDNNAGAGLLLRKGRLYDPKQKAIPGVAGTIEMKKKRVTLTAPEGDVQVFQLGEVERD